MEIKEIFRTFLWLVQDVLKLPADITFAGVVFVVSVFVIFFVGRVLHYAVFAPIINTVVLLIYLAASAFIAMTLTDAVFPDGQMLQEVTSTLRTKLLSLLL